MKFTDLFYLVTDAVADPKYIHDRDMAWMKQSDGE